MNVPAGVMLFVTFAVLVAVEIPIAISLGVSALVTILAFDLAPLTLLPQSLVGAADSWSLLAIPLFIFAGNILAKTGVSRRLVNLARAVTGGTRGGLAFAAIIACIFFAGISGSGPADTAALGALLIPALAAEGYDRRFASGLLAAGGGIGIIVPPSIALIIYGVVAGADISRLFIAGVVPGIVVGVSLGVVAFIKSPPKSDAERPRVLTALKESAWVLAAPVILLGGIYSGIFSPTEAATVAVVYSLVVGIAVYRDVKLSQLPAIAVESAAIAAAVMFVVACASCFSWVLTTQGIASGFAQGLLAISGNRIVMLLMINAALIVAGLFLDAISIFYIFMPIFVPVVKSLGVDPIHFGIIVTINLAIGQITPPVGVNLFVAARVGQVPLGQLSRAVLPIIAAELVALLLVTFVPWLSLCLL